MNDTRRYAVWLYPRSRPRSWWSEKLRRWPISKYISSVGMHVIKRLMVNYDNPRQYLNFNRTDLWYSSSVSGDFES